VPLMATKSALRRGVLQQEKEADYEPKAMTSSSMIQRFTNMTANDSRARITRSRFDGGNGGDGKTKWTPGTRPSHQTAAYDERGEPGQPCQANGAEHGRSHPDVE
jgi:hypothetical protein